MAIFETEMTVGKAACPVRGIAQHQAPEPEDIPYPEGDGWCLVSILPVPFNEPFLQYFWQRDIESEDEFNDGVDTNPNVDIQLSGQ